MDGVPKFVVGRLQTQVLDHDSHPDADLLTAFAEHSLSQWERGGVMRHLALCADCREVVALAMPEAELQPVPTLPDRRPAGWFGLPALRWGVLAAGIAAIAAVGFEYSHSHEHRNTAAADSLQRTAPAVTATSSESNQELSAPAANSPDEVSRNARPSAHRAVQQHPPQQSQTPTDSSAMVAMNHAPLIVPGNGTEIVKAKDPVAQATTVNQVPSPNIPLQTSPSMMLRASPKWAITPAGTLQRSFDGGKSWEKISPTGSTSNEGPVFHAVAGTGSEVWVGGAAGLLYHSGDSGNHWDSVRPSDGGVGLTGDIISIDFSDPQHGRISTSNAELWITSDSAQTWHKQQ